MGMLKAIPHISSVKQWTTFTNHHIFTSSSNSTEHFSELKD